MTYRPTLSPSEIQQHVAQSHALWGQGTSIESRYEALQRRIDEGLLTMSGLVDERGLVVASLKRYSFPIRAAGKRLAAAGLGAIFTHPDHRKKGHGETLIRTVLDESRESGVKAAVLYSDIDAKFYEKLGFKATPASKWTLALADLEAGTPLEVRTAKIGPSGNARSEDSPAANTSDFSPGANDDLARLLRWHAANASRSPIWTERDETTWRLFHALNDVGRDLLLSRRGQEVGYATVTPVPSKKYLWIEEWSAPGVADTEVWATLQKIARDEGLEELRGWTLPNQSPSDALVSASGGAPVRIREGALKIEQRLGAVPMIAALDPALELRARDLERAYFASPDHF